MSLPHGLAHKFVMLGASCIFIVTFAVAMLHAGAARALARPVVVELFTSQGCSSCPPADEILGALAERNDVLPLAFHVDYWDYLGWRDPFSSAGYTARQRAYARNFNMRSVFTPQVVIDGHVSEVGSYRDAIENHIQQQRASAVEIPVRITAKKNAGTGNPQAMITLGASADSSAADVTLVRFDRHTRTAVPRGENSGRTLDGHNVVRGMEALEAWNGMEHAYEVVRGSEDAFAVLVQKRGQGRVLGAAVYDWNLEK